MYHHITTILLIMTPHPASQYQQKPVTLSPRECAVLVTTTHHFMS